MWTIIIAIFGGLCQLDHAWLRTHLFKMASYFGFFVGLGGWSGLGGLDGLGFLSGSGGLVGLGLFGGFSPGGRVD